MAVGAEEAELGAVLGAGYECSEELLVVADLAFLSAAAVNVIELENADIRVGADGAPVTVEG